MKNSLPATTMRAIVKFDAPLGSIELREIPVPRPRENEVLVAVRACGVDRGGDLYIWKSTPGMPFKIPVVPGAENCGEVAAVGSAVRDWSVGDRVVSEVIVGSCGHCERCMRGDFRFCIGKKDLGRAVDGAFAEYYTVAQQYLHRIPDNVSWRAAVLTEMAAVAAHNILETIIIRPDHDVAVIGPGPVGLLAAQMAKIAGARRVVLLGLQSDEFRMKIAREHLGLTEQLLVDSQDFQDRLQASYPNGFPVVVEASGSSTGADLALNLAAPRGTVAAIGTPLGKKLSVDWVRIAVRQLTVQGTYAHVWSTWELVLALMGSGKLITEPLYTGSFTLEQWEEAFNLSDKSADVIKIGICPFDRI